MRTGQFFFFFLNCRRAPAGWFASLAVPFWPIPLPPNSRACRRLFPIAPNLPSARARDCRFSFFYHESKKK
ncbi:hypothetical protein [Pandoravirus japonicus]|uniref:Uncharacterized protein n=1 Tax=Pandoravirus japonicus TaxID=2823154 RepID=A0A811BNT3_9VIRU|nr:hypothetical protein [Pandoravirus japonicus]